MKFILKDVTTHLKVVIVIAKLMANPLANLTFPNVIYFVCASFNEENNSKRKE